MVVGLLVVAACAPGAPAPTPTTSTIDPCLLEAPPEALDTSSLTVVLSDPVRPPSSARVPNRSEAIVYRHLYNSLVRVDCQGMLEPALALAWEPESGGHVWRLTLRAGARFADGSPANADAFAAWIGEARSRGQWLLEATGLDSVRGAGAVDLVLSFSRSHATLPMTFADPALAPRVREDVPWPSGAGPYRLAGEPGSSSGTRGRGSPQLFLEPFAGAGRSIEFRSARGVELRDALHEGADLVVAEDPGVRDYAATLAGFTVVPLPWDRVYVLAVPAASDPAEGIPDALRAGLARDAVRVDARASAGEYWWDRQGDCPLGARVAPGRANGGQRRIVFRRDDAVARALAERLIAVTAVGADDPAGGADAVRALVGRNTTVVRGESDEAFAAGLESGADAAYVLSLPRRVYDECGAILMLRAAAPWLERFAARFVPLVETRAYVVMRDGAARLRVEWDGVPVVSAHP